MTVLRVMTWNIQGGRSNSGQPVISEQALFIKGQAPDVVMLQEVQAASAADAGVEQIEVLSQLSGLIYHAFWELEEWHGIHGGIGMLSRYPLTDVAQEPVPRPLYTYLPWSWEGQRGILLASALIGGMPYRLLSTHVSVHGGEYADKHMHLLAQLVQQIPQGVWPILGGDFNMSLAEPAFGELRRWMDVTTWSEPPPEVDQIWVGKFVPHKVTGGGMVNCGGLSDHDPLVAVLERSAPPPPPRLTARCAPYPLPVPVRQTPGTTSGTVQAAVVASDANGTHLAGTVRLNASALGYGTMTAATGQTIAVPYKSTVSVDPVTHEHETSVTLPSAMVSVAGYSDQAVDWGV
jgi:endonuclease/exonuclease/phosphatase family metal-dependent hydrolase